MTALLSHPTAETIGAWLAQLDRALLEREPDAGTVAAVAHHLLVRSDLRPPARG